MEPLICTTCKCDISPEGLVCPRRLCPLDHFTSVGEIELDVTAPKKPRKAKRYYMPTESMQQNANGGPAPSDTLKRYE